MQWLAEVCVQRPVFATVLMLTIVVSGIAGLQSLSVDAFPKVQFPTVSVITRLDGSSPEEIENNVTDKIEAALNTISGVDELRSISSEGVSQVYVSFVLTRDVDSAIQDVRDHVATVMAELPEGVRSPQVQKMDPDSAPILYLAVRGRQNLRALTEIADKQIRRSLENISGVGEVTLIGGRKRKINIWLNLNQLAAYRLSPTQVRAAILGQNLLAPSGKIQSGIQDIGLRVAGRVESLEELSSLVVGSYQNGLVRLKDVARVEDGEEESSTGAILNDDPALVLSLRKQSGENTVDIVKKVRERIEELNQTLPQGIQMQVVLDTSLSINTQVHAVTEHLILGALFSSLVVLLFLGSLRSTLISSLAIPISIVGTFALMAALQFSLNILTLLALALAVGIVIDDAIVVLENIVRFIEEKGYPPTEAAILATKDIGLAVLATTLSLLAVFLPVAFMGGIVGRFLNSFGLTMGFAIFVSMIVSFTITPMLAARLLQGNSHGHAPGHPIRRSWLHRLVDAFYLPLEMIYRETLGWALKHPWIILMLCGLSLATIPTLFNKVGKGFLPENDEANFEVNIRAPEGTSLARTQLIAQDIARQIREKKEVRYTLITIGDNAQKTPNLASIYVRISNPDQRDITQLKFINKIREEIITKLPSELRVDVSEVQAFETGSSSKAIEYLVNGPDLKILTQISEAVLAEFRQVPGAVDVDSSNVVGKPEIKFRILRNKAASLGVQVADIAQTLQIAAAGMKVSTFEENGESYDIHLQAEQSVRRHIDRLAMLPVIGQASGQSVLIRDVVDFIPDDGPSEIKRLARRRQVSFTANIAPGYSEVAIQTALENIIRKHLPSKQYTSGPTGRTKETGRTGQSFINAFLLSFIFMYLILAAQFESFIHPFTILFCLPLTVPFALLSLLLFGQGLNIQSGLGLLVLFGVVKKNSILQIDHINQLRATGMQRSQAVLKGSVDRLRPILMTTIAFVAGMIPLITAKGIGAGFNRSIAGIVVGGQSLSLILTLLATPVLYERIDILIEKAQSWWPKKPKT